jgi:hypothetical protein
MKNLLLTVLAFGLLSSSAFAEARAGTKAVQTRRCFWNKHADGLLDLD